MPEILIQYCRLRILRRQGWSWGPGPPALVRSALDALPALLAERLTNILPSEGEDVTIQSLRVQLPVTAAELRGTNALAPAAPTLSALAGHSLGERLDAALRHALAASDASHLLRGQQAPQSADFVHKSSEHRPEPFWSRGPPLDRLLASWHGTGTLAVHLRLLTPAALATLCRLVTTYRDGARLAATLAPDAAAIVRAARAFVSEAPESHGHAGEKTHLIWLLAAAELSVRFALPPGHPAIVSSLDAILPRPESRSSPPVSVESRAAADPVSAFPLETPTSGQRAAPLHLPATRPSRDNDEVLVASALPFLLLGPLSHIGYLDSLAAVLEAAGLRAHLPAFAVALAYKVLPPPERGWRRSEAARRAAAAFAGLEEPPAEAELNALHRLTEYLELPSAVLAQSLISGHVPGTPTLLAPAGEGLLLTEAAGVFPIAWGAASAEILPALRSLGEETLFVPRAVARPALLRELDEHGVRFVTDAPPTRDESWRSLRRSTAGRCWTNDRLASDAVLTRHAADASGVMEEVTDAWRALANERPSLALETGSRVDRALTVAAGVALASLAWTLWRDREPTTAMLALQRLGNLDARVRFGSKTVQVLVPLGRRHRDLFACGLLGPVRDVPWLGGRVLELGGG